MKFLWLEASRYISKKVALEYSLENVRFMTGSNIGML